ncbi:hypothetical protein SAMN05421819_0373 [Bryocella elongata]|uniref:DUF1680 family protein n=1 Tax=Bryocella elongata TaxID=863522 RepID=A0A1H5SVH9_9BACT|nr:beta-L-arabinofuranosidase domain-containing protein [Bryocella elongata]SEF54602.1 hypothetical protein SAMN05421819_0373 [Bryocella elongata]
MNRRHFVQSASVFSAAALLQTRGVPARATVPASTTRPTKLQQLDYSQVELLNGPMKQQFDQNHAFFLRLDNDRMLMPFRLAAGLPAPGDDMGGWYAWTKIFTPDTGMPGFASGHAFGQWVSALSRAYAVTGDRATQQKVHTLVSEYARTISPKFYETYNFPCYTYDKLNIGLIDAHQFAVCPTAFDALNATTDVALPHFPERALTRAEQHDRPHRNDAYTWDEPYTLPENFYLAYQRGAGDRYHKLAQQYLQDREYFDPLARGENPAVHDHAYSHVNALNSAAQAYLTDGSDKHLRAAHNGFALLQQQSFATGGWGPNETIVRPGTNELADSLTKTHSSFETPCGAYGHFKIARYLMRVSGDPSYGDSMETVLYNTVLGSLPITEEGHAFYYSDYNQDAVKTYHPDKWPCCSGTLPQITADYHISTAFCTARGLSINLYTPSRIRWQQGAARLLLTQATTYPHGNEVTLHLDADRTTQFPLDLRIPAWAGPQTRISINGKAFQQPLIAGTWFTIDRTWRKGDRVEIEFDMPLRLAQLDAEHPNFVALMCGPQTLFAVLPLANEQLTRAQLLSAQRVSSTSTDWTVATERGPITFRPFTSLNKEHYRLYHQVS